MKSTLFAIVALAVTIPACAQYVPQPLKHNFYLDEFKRSLEKIDAQERQKEEQTYRQREFEQRKVQEEKTDEKSVWFVGLYIGQTWEQVKQIMSHYGKPDYIDIIGSTRILYSFITVEGITFHGIILEFKEKKLYKMTFTQLFEDKDKASLLCDLFAKKFQLIKQDPFDNVFKIYAGDYQDVVLITCLKKGQSAYSVDLLVIDPKIFYKK